MLYVARRESSVLPVWKWDMLFRQGIGNRLLLCGTSGSSLPQIIDTNMRVNSPGNLVDLMDNVSSRSL